MTVPGYSGWRQRSPDFVHSSLGGPPPPQHGPRRRTTVPLALAALAVLLAAVTIFVVRADGADDDRVAAEIERLSQPPVIHEARLVEDRIELDVDDTESTDYCLDPSLVRDDRECDRRMGGPPRFYLDDLTLDADELVGREITVTARSTVTTGDDGATPFGGYVVSEPSSPVEVVDAR